MALKNLCDAGIVDPYPPLCDVKGCYTAQCVPSCWSALRVECPAAAPCAGRGAQPASASPRLPAPPPRPPARPTAGMSTLCTCTPRARRCCRAAKTTEGLAASRLPRRAGCPQPCPSQPDGTTVSCSLPLPAAAAARLRPAVAFCVRAAVLPFCPLSWQRLPLWYALSSSPNLMQQCDAKLSRMRVCGRRLAAVHRLAKSSGRRASGDDGRRPLRWGTPAGRGAHPRAAWTWSAHPGCDRERNTGISGARPAGSVTFTASVRPATPASSPVCSRNLQQQPWRKWRPPLRSIWSSSSRRRPPRAAPSCWRRSWCGCAGVGARGARRLPAPGAGCRQTATRAAAADAPRTPCPPSSVPQELGVQAADIKKLKEGGECSARLLWRSWRACSTAAIATAAACRRSNTPARLLHYSHPPQASPRWRA